MSPIKPINLVNISKKQLANHCVECIILTHDNRLLLQQRGNDWQNFPGLICAFGGHIEKGESPIQALLRELHEELGAKVDERDVITLGAFTEEYTKHTELIYAYFWHDKKGIITGCYEGEAKYFNSVEMVLREPKVMAGVVWALGECQKREILGELNVKNNNYETM